MKRGAEIPNDWDVAQISDICFIGRGRVINQLELNQHPGIYPVYSSQSKDEGIFGYLDTFDFEGEYVTWTTDGAYAGSVFYRSEKFNCTNVCGTLKAKSEKLNMKYLALALSMRTGKHVSYVGNPKLMNNVMAKIIVPVPPPEEQCEIAEIIDTLDKTIALTSSLIAKLKQIRAGLLHDLLTRGLDEDGKLRDAIAHPEQFKDSPLGRIPKDWEVGKLRDFYAIPARNGLYKPAKFYGQGALMIHMPQMFRGLIIDVSDAAHVDVSPSELERFQLQSGDLVFARRSLNLEGAGRCSLVPDLPEPTTYESSIIRVRLSIDKLRPVFANYFLNSELGFRLRLPLIRQVAVSGVSSEDIASIFVLCPPPKEQDAIIKIILINDNRINAEESYCNKLKQQKKGIMHDLLTGKIRVNKIQKII